jgi:hypothetical protein
VLWTLGTKGEGTGRPAERRFSNKDAAEKFVENLRLLGIEAVVAVSEK